MCNDTREREKNIYLLHSIGRGTSAGSIDAALRRVPSACHYHRRCFRCPLARSRGSQQRRCSRRNPVCAASSPLVAAVAGRATPVAPLRHPCGALACRTLKLSRGNVISKIGEGKEGGEFAHTIEAIHALNTLLVPYGPWSSQKC